MMMFSTSVFLAGIILAEPALSSSEYMKREHSLIKPYQGVCHWIITMYD